MNPFDGFSLSPNYCQVNALALAQVSKLAYEPRGIIERIAWAWKLDLQYYDQDDTQAIILENQDFLILAFRGTEVDPDDILTDLDFWKVSGPLGGKVHRGFRAALDDIWELPDGPFHHIDNMMRSREKKPIFITGHSLGAALATMASFCISGNIIRIFGWKPAALVTPFLMFATSIPFVYFFGGIFFC